MYIYIYIYIYIYTYTNNSNEPIPCCSVCYVGAHTVREREEEEYVESAKEASDHSDGRETPDKISSKNRKREKGHPCNANRHSEMPKHSVVRLNQTHAVSHNICGFCVPRRRCPVVPPSGLGTTFTR